MVGSNKPDVLSGIVKHIGVNHLLQPGQIFGLIFAVGCGLLITMLAVQLGPR